MLKSLPKGWKKVKLGNISSKEKFSIRMGPFGSQLKKHELVNKGIKVLWIENIVNNRFEWKDNKCITPDKYKQLKGFQVKPKDVLTTTMGTIGKSCVVPDNIGQAIISSHLLKISLDLNIADPKFIVYYIRLPFSENYFDRSSHGIVMKGLNTTIIKMLPIYLPPLSAQHKIVEILEEADNLRKLRRGADEKMQDLIPSLFVQMFGDPVTNPKGWEMKNLGQLAEFKSGGTPSRKTSAFFNGNVPWVTTVALNKPYLTKEDAIELITEDAIINSATKLIQRKSLLFGTRVGVGNMSINLCDICFSQDVVAMLYDEDLLIPEYLYSFLLGKKHILEGLTQGSTIKGITVPMLKDILVPIPAISLQKEFAEHVKKIEAMKARQAESKKKLDELFNSLMQRAFTGKLVA